VDIRALDRENLNFENNLRAQRLLPWPTLNAPFEASWCVVAPGTTSTPHAHHEAEIFVAISGEAVLDANGERSPFKAGDVVHFRPDVEHSVTNTGTEDFQMYCVWWDTEMSEKFVARHQSEA
jgi:mannose-6-phosphate isomerase-like protein (cupin superfamily)